MSTLLKWSIRIALASLLSIALALKERIEEVKHDGGKIASERYLQEVSHKSVFADFQPTDDEPLSDVWEKLPFGSLEKGF